MYNKICLSYFILSMTFFLTNCTNRSTTTENKTCQEFNNSYSLILKDISNRSDTAVLIKKLSTIINNSKGCVDAYLTRGDLYLSVDSLKLAEKDYFMALHLDNNNTYSFYQLGILYHLVNNEDSATYFFKKSLNTKTTENKVVIDYNEINKELSTDNDKYDIPYDEIIYQMAKSYYYKREMNKAIENFNICIQDNYMLDHVFLYRGAVYYEMGRKELACQDFFKAKGLGNQEVDNYIKKYCNNR